MKLEWTFDSIDYGKYDVIVVQTRAEMIEEVLSVEGECIEAPIGYTSKDQEVPFVLFNLDDFLEYGDFIPWHEAGHLAFSLLRKLEYDWESEDQFLYLQRQLFDSIAECLYATLAECKVEGTTL